MAKAKNEIAKTQGTGGALAQQPSAYAVDYQMEGSDRSDMMMPRIILHQGDISEKYYGQHPKGTLLDNATQEILTGRKFACTGVAWKEWMRFEDGAPVYITRDVNDVPEEDLKWHDREPPAAELRRNFIILLEGCESPICLSLKDASKKQRQAGKMLNQLESTRAKLRRIPGHYELVIVDAENNKGKWKEITIKPIGDCPEDLAAQVLQWHGLLKGATIKVAEDGGGETSVQTDSTYDPDSDA